MEKLIDCHAHLIYEDINPAQVILDMPKDNMSAIICVGTQPSDVGAVLACAKQNKNVYAAIAYHPEYASQITEDDFKMLEKLACDSKVVVLGECGLDYHYTKDNKEDQKRIFIRQIELAEKLKKPIMLHIREAEEDAIEILKPHVGKLKNIIVHCYSAVSEEITRQFVNMGAYISFAGNFTYKKFRREDAALVPLDRLLVETDSPFLSPEPLRGTKNKPSNVKYVLERLADQLNMSVEKLAPIILENAKRVFGI